jgi:dolichol kinase
MHLLGMPHALYVLLPLTTLGMAGDVARAYSTPFNEFIRRVFGSMMRLRELPPPGHGVVINGATWVLVAATLLALVFPLRIAVPIFTMFMVSDAVAALVGRHWGRHRWGSTPRTVEGSAAFLIVGLGVMSVFSALPVALGVAATIVACVAEALPHPGNDNVRVPMVSALAVVALEWAWLGQSVALFPVLRGG